MTNSMPQINDYVVYTTPVSQFTGLFYISHREIFKNQIFVFLRNAINNVPYGFVGLPNSRLHNATVKELIYYKLID
jgi:hypothetical protein